jgi:hypothetical protein
MSPTAEQLVIVKMLLNRGAIPDDDDLRRAIDSLEWAKKLEPSEIKRFSLLVDVLNAARVK